MKMEQTECSKMSAHKIQMPGNHPKERIQHSEHGKSLKSRSSVMLVTFSSQALWYSSRSYLTSTVVYVITSRKDSEGKNGKLWESSAKYLKPHQLMCSQNGTPWCPLCYSPLSKLWSHLGLHKVQAGGHPDHGMTSSEGHYTAWTIVWIWHCETAHHVSDIQCQLLF